MAYVMTDLVRLGTLPIRGTWKNEPGLDKILLVADVAAKKEMPELA